MSERNATPSPAAPRGGIVFEGFPYLVTRIVPGLHHIILLPRGGTAVEYLGFARLQSEYNRLPTCLAVSTDRCVYFPADGNPYASANLPRAGTIVSEALKPVVPVPRSAELSIRRMRLVRIEEGQYRGPGTTIMFGDLTKGGRPPSPEEENRLAGTHADGVPKGLLPCLSCGEWRGECFDTLNTGLVVRVHCTCENDNRCARCGGLLSDRKLNANFFYPVDLTIWHVPGFAALEHPCGRP